MSARTWIGTAAVVAGLGVVLGAFGAHALKDRLVEAGQLENWHTAVRYQMWHALALLVWATHRDRSGETARGRTGGSSVAWCFSIGTLFFSGSLYCLSLGVLGKVMGPITPLGGLILIIGWLLFAVGSLRSSHAQA